jgi:hypothetical protein
MERNWVWNVCVHRVTVQYLYIMALCYKPASQGAMITKMPVGQWSYDGGTNLKKAQGGLWDLSWLHFLLCAGASLLPLTALCFCWQDNSKQLENGLVEDSEDGMLVNLTKTAQLSRCRAPCCHGVPRQKLLAASYRFSVSRSWSSCSWWHQLRDGGTLQAM